MASYLRKRLSLNNFKIENSKFKLHHDRPSDFVQSVASESAIFYAILVTCATVHTLTMSIYSGITSAYREKILIWLTYWSFFTLTARFLLTTFNVWAFIFGQRWAATSVQNGLHSADKPAEEVTEMPTLYKVQWVLQSVSNCSALLVSALYWTIMYTPEKTESVRSIHSHGLNIMFVLGDLLLSRAPVRIHHFIFPFIFVAVYILFSAVYWAAGGLNHLGQRYIYSLLDYSNSPGRAVFVFVAVDFVAVPLLQACIYGIFRFREWYSPRWCGRFRNEPVTVYSINVVSRSSLGGDRDSTLTNIHAADGESSHAAGLQKIDEDGVMATDKDVDFEMEDLESMKQFRPPLLHNMSEVSCADSTKGLLN